MERQEMLKWKKAAWQKLMGAIAMLLVASIMMSATSYAWFVLSTAPEVTDLTTTAGANGALEIAIPGTKVSENGMKEPAEPTSITGASSLPTVESNKYWGNMIDVATSYGLENLVLYPSRLNLSQTITNTVERSAPLNVPTYGTDGRISSTTPVGKSVYDAAGRVYKDSDDYGVHLLGFFEENESADQNKQVTYQRQDIIELMADNIDTARTEMKADLTNLLETHSQDILQLLYEMRFRSSDMGPFQLDAVSENSGEAMNELIQGLGKITNKALDTMRYAFMASAAADTTNYPDTEEGRAALGKLYKGLSTMSTDDIKSIAEKNGYTAVTESLDAVYGAVNSVNEANRLYTSQPDLLSTAMVLFNLGNLELGGQSALSVYGVLDKMMGESKTSEMYVWAGESISNASPFAALAKILGDYTVNIQADLTSDFLRTKSGKVILREEMDEETGKKTIYYAMNEEFDETTDPDQAMEYGAAYNLMFGTFDGVYKIQMNVGGEETKEGFSPSTQTGTLKTVYNTVGTYQAGGQFTVSEIVTELKTAYGYTVDFAIRASKAGDLLLQQDAVDRVNNASEESTTMGSGSMIQLTETADDIDDLSGLLKSLSIVFYNTRTGQIYCMATVDSTNVRTNGGKIQAPLELHNVNISDMGVITPGNRVDRILQMVEDETYYISALVYVNGDTIQGSYVSAQNGTSMTGCLNIQFASSAELTPMAYQDFVVKTENN